MRILPANRPNLPVEVIAAVFANCPDLLVLGRVRQGEDFNSVIVSKSMDGLIRQAAIAQDAHSSPALLWKFPALKSNRPTRKSFYLINCSGRHFDYLVRSFRAASCWAALNRFRWTSHSHTRTLQTTRRW